jgi:periplasmic divalent cation tolerance protein
LLYITAPNREVAESLGRFLVESRLAACANVIDGVTSIYRWKGEIQSDTEAICIAKTSHELIDKATRAIVERHPYELPCVVALDITAGHDAFLQWIEESVSPQRDEG